MQPPTRPPPTRPPRADAALNRERLLAAAASVLGAGGAQASLDAVARRAGVGIGTLYRHFPTRDALFEAVYRHEVEQLAQRADQLADAPDPVHALGDWLRANLAFVATKKGLAAALAIAVNGKPDLIAYSSGRLTRAVAGLMDRAVAAGAIRADVGPEDVLRMLLALCHGADTAGRENWEWQARVIRLLDVFVDGLRVRPPGGVAPEPPQAAAAAGRSGPEPPP